MTNILIYYHVYQFSPSYDPIGSSQLLSIIVLSYLEFCYNPGDDDKFVLYNLFKLYLMELEV